MIMLRVGIQLNPPLLQTYILPSGPSAAPLGPPGICATTSLRPSGQTLVSRFPRISTSTTEPSGITTGPSGNSRPVASTRTSGIKPPRFYLRAHGLPRCAFHVGATLGQSPWGLQAAATHVRRRAGLPGSFRRLLPYRDPDLKTAIARDRIEMFVIALEGRRVGDFQAGCRQPMVPDRIDGVTDGGVGGAGGEHGITLLGHPDTRERTRQIGEIGDFNARDVVEIAGIVAVAADAISDFADAMGNIVDRVMKALPLAWNARTVLVGVAVADARHEQRPRHFETWGVEIFDDG